VVFTDPRVMFAGAPAALVGYGGTRGCKLTLIAAALPGLFGPDLERISDGKRSAYAWQHGELAYLLVSEGMASERLARIAQSVHRASLERLPFSAPTQTALRRDRRDSRPCVA
jgi:hypothetical protein